jgi:hypothetical protein
MRLRYCFLVTGLMAGTVTAASGQDPEPGRRAVRRPWVRLEQPFRRPMMETHRFRMAPERMRAVEGALERARLRAQTLSGDRLHRIRDRELEMRERMAERMNTSFRRGMIERERAMDRVRERLDRVRDEQRVLRRRWRTI